MESSMKKSSTKPTMPRNTQAKKRERSVSGLRTKMNALGVELDTDNPNVRIDIDSFISLNFCYVFSIF